MTSYSASETRDRLEKVLADSIECALGLKGILVQEKSALEQRDSDSLAKTAALKESGVRKLAALDAARTGIGREAGFPGGLADMPALTEWCDRGSVIARLWQRFVQVVRECNAMNATNGAVIRVRQQQVLAGITLLRGGDPGLGTYGAKGPGNSVCGGRALAEV